MFSKIILALACTGSAAYYGRQGRHMMQMEGDVQPASGYDAQPTGYGATSYTVAAPEPEVNYTVGATAPEQTGYGASYQGVQAAEYATAEPAYGAPAAGYGQATGYGAAPEPQQEKKPMILIGLIIAASIALVLLATIIILCIVGYRFCGESSSSTSSFMFLQRIDEMLGSRSE